MVNQSSIKYISSLLSNPETITSGDQSSIALFRQTFPFFVPVRYLAAVEKNKQSPYSNEMLSEIQPYLGDWMLFCDFLEAGARAKDKVLDKKKVDVSPLPTSPATSSASTMPTNSSVEQPAAKQQQPVFTPPVKEEPATDKKEEQKEPVQDKPAFKIDSLLPELEILGVDAVTFIEETEETPAAQPVAAAEEPAVATHPQSVLVTEVVAEQQTDPIAAERPAAMETEATIAASPEVSAEQVAEMTAPEAIQQITLEEPVVGEPVAVAAAEETIAAPPFEEQAPVATTADDISGNIIEQQPQTAESGIAEEVTDEVVATPVVEVVAPQPVTVEDPIVVEVTFEEHKEAQAESSTEEDTTEEIFAQTIPIFDIPQSKDPLISPVYTQDYFLQQGEKISEEIPDELGDLVEHEEESDEDKSLMVMMSFSEWLLHFKNTSEKQQEEKKDQKALKTMWQKEKLAAAMEEENEEIPENVFQMAVNSITKEEDLASEPLANIYIKQGRYDQAIEMYRKLSLRNPQKSTYFARKIEEIQKEKS